MATLVPTQVNLTDSLLQQCNTVFDSGFHVGPLLWLFKRSATFNRPCSQGDGD